MAEFVAGNDPADHTVTEVNEFLRNGDPTADEYERVIESERAGRGRVGIISGSGAEADPFPAAVDGEGPAGPNERATGQVSPADRAKTVDDPNASGDAALTAEPYPDDAPASLGPEQPQSKAEADAHAATVANLEAAESSSVVESEVLDENKPKTQTPAEALQLAIDKTKGYRRPTEDTAAADDE